MKQQTPSISVVVASHNEGELLDGCLASVVNFADEIVVFDMQSSDLTVDVAQKYGVRVISHKPVPYIELLRNKMGEATRGQWILVLDPDEQMQPELKKKLKEVVEEDKWDAVNIPRKNIFFGHWIHHTNWWPDRHVRFFKKGAVRWSSDIHVYPKVWGKVLDLPAKPELALVHYGYETLTQFITRQNRYSDIEARVRFEKGERFSWWNFLWRPTREFLVRYIRHLGFLDGFYGLALTVLMMMYQMSVQIKMWQIQHGEGFTPSNSPK